MLIGKRTWISTKRRGSLYILTLASAIVLVGLVMGTARIIWQFRRYSCSNFHGNLAQHYAMHGIRHAIYFTTVTPNWRNLLNSGVWLQDIAVDQATYTVEGIDIIDGDLANDTDNPVILKCTATVGGVSRTLQVEAHSRKMEFLNYCAVAGTTLKIENHAVIHGDIASNNNIDKNGSDTWVFGDARAAGDITDTSQITGETIENAEPLVLPTSQTVYDFYAPKATIIPYQNEIFAKLISPTNNPWGAANPDGVYLMDCSDQRVIIKQSRIVGTLILVNPKNDSAVEISVNWRPARTDYPAFIILGGEFEFKIDRPINEMDINTDLSMPGEPGYGMKMNTFGGEIHGMIFTTNKLQLSQLTRLFGMAVSLGELNPRDDSRIDPDPLAPDPPIQPFVNPPLIPVRGSYQLITPP